MESKRQKLKVKNKKFQNILFKIVEKKKEDLLVQKPQIALENFKKKQKRNESSNKFRKAVIQVDGICIIGEIKLASPSNPRLGSEKELLTRVKEYEANGISAVSIITEPHFFKGDSVFVAQVKKNVNLPILQKDFVIDAIQIYQAKQIGSDALLLIARILDDNTLKVFVDLCLTLSIEPVVEIYNEEDLRKAIQTKTRIIAVNARNLQTLKIDIAKACLLLKKIPKKFIKLGFSGVTSKKEFLQYQEAGAKGVLIGTSLMQAKNLEKFINELRVTEVEGFPIARIARSKRARREGASGRTRKVTKVKICGVRDLESAQVSVEAGADFLGFNFVPTSKRFIDPEKAKKIIDQVRASKKNLATKIVGVFQEAASEEVNSIAKKLQLDFVQLHGNEDEIYRKKINAKIIQRIHMDGTFTDKQKTEYFLLDREIQGKGKMIDLKIAKELARVFPTFIAGGLTPKNIAGVVKQVEPFAVDVAGGIEINGVQDKKKIKQFIKNAKEVSI